MRLTCLLLALCASLAHAAPAPAFRVYSASDLHLTGEWRMSWGSAEFVYHFRPDGRVTCHASDSGDIWEGTYRTRGRTLFLSERPSSGKGTLDWSVQLDQQYRGKSRGLYIGVDVELRRVR